MRLIWNGHSCAVYCSHDHRDHGARELVALTGEKPDVAVETIHTWHDDQQGAQRGPNTIHIFQAEGLRVAHLGDLGCELEPEQKDALKGLDALMIPVGGFYTIDAKQARALVDQTVPMHYRGGSFGYDVIGPLEDYLELCGDVVRYPGNVLVLDKDTPGQTAVLTYLPQK